MGSGMTSQDLFLAMVLLRDSVAFYYFDCSMVVPVETENYKLCFRGCSLNQ